ncbi:transglycosylase protein with SLT domain [Diaminobutyricimonas aerilata]|uniref:Transglycosylase protein with SLT domain n=1 Tax=Diaminobutyricimonas aerilata TaxID=1162967 RepID=A0A2M9CM68_9MICO|nr:lytic murein transglycosylase [Diaminobutyricimonas aerilata]PJJ73001.1 transglycosylase protein with SLT domain [Diaminobutyricimonas aerilata]
MNAGHRGRTGWLLPSATALLAALGAGALVAAALLPAPQQAAAPTPERSAPTDTAQPVPERRHDAQAATPVADLADPAWLARTSVATDIPPRALAAYAGAALDAEQTHPGCGLGWNTLAAIGLVESGHGTLGGGALDGDGVASPPVVGVPLDGRGVDAVADTDGGALDGDGTWDRAVGPMQFIPSTWASTARDGDRDGRTDIHDLDDAALTAAEHLCDVGGDLTEPSAWIAAIGAYNSSVDYNNRVAAAADDYAARASA